MENEKKKNNTSINEFISQIKQSGLARTNRYMVRFTPPISIETDSTRKLVLFCEQIQLPGQNYSTTQNRIFGEFREVPYERIYDNISMSFLVDSGMNVKKIFDRWMNSIADPKTRTYNYYTQYIVDMDIEVQDLLDNTRYAVKLYECYPKSIGNIQMDYSSKDIMKLQVNMQYKYWTSDTTASLDNKQIIPTQMISEYTDDFDAFQTKVSNFSLGDAQNYTTGLVANYTKKWNMDNLSELIKIV